jgi:hypothetical protein
VRIGCDWPPEDIIRIGKVDDDNLVLLANLFSHTDDMAGFKSQQIGFRVKGGDNIKRFGGGLSWTKEM